MKADKLDDKTIGEVRAARDRRARADREAARRRSRARRVRRADADAASSTCGAGSRSSSTRRRASASAAPARAGSTTCTSCRTTKGFKKSLTLRPELAAIDAARSPATANPWRDRLKTWGLTETPFGLAARPSPDAAQAARQRARGADRRRARAPAEAVRHEGRGRDARALRAGLRRRDRRSSRRPQKSVELPPLVATPPMTLDDGLQYTQTTIGSVPALRRDVRLDGERARAARVRRRRGRRADDAVYLAALPTLLSDAGVIVERHSRSPPTR